MFDKLQQDLRSERRCLIAEKERLELQLAKIEQAMALFATDPALESAVDKPYLTI